MARPTRQEMAESQRALKAKREAEQYVPQVARNGYSPTKLYTASSDTRGHHEELRFKVPPGLLELLVTYSENNPGLDTKYDAARNCIVHWLKYMSDDPSSHIPPDLMQHEIRMTEMDRILRLDRAVDDEVAKAREVFEKCVANQAWTTLNNTIESIQEQIEISEDLEPGHINKLEAVIEEGWSLIHVAEAMNRRKTRDEQ